jgi:hypothetical protein
MVYGPYKAPHSSAKGYKQDQLKTSPEEKKIPLRVHQTWLPFRTPASQHASEIPVQCFGLPYSAGGPTPAPALLHLQVHQGKPPSPLALDAIAILVAWSLYSRSPPAKNSAIFDHDLTILGWK